MMNYSRVLLAFVFSVVLSIALGAIIIPLLKRLKAGQNILGYVDNHVGKAGTTTMGGLIFALSTLICFFLFCKGDKSLCYVTLSVAGSFLVVGFLDDLIKIKFHHNEGLKAGQKLIFQCAISLIIALFIYFKGHTDFFIPVINRFWDLKWFGLIIVFFTFIAVTNCVNLTDGLDGLAGGVSYVYLLLLTVLICVQVNLYNKNYVLPEELLNLAFLCIVQVGGLLGFLFYNTYSAKVFMGDTGSLYLGGFIASCSILSGNTFFIPFFGIMFVLSGISVIVQVAHFKRTGRRVFLMAPLHHHFEYKGHSESKIVFAYKLLTLLVGVICIISVMRG